MPEIAGARVIKDSHTAENGAGGACHLHSPCGVFESGQVARPVREGFQVGAYGADFGRIKMREARQGNFRHQAELTIAQTYPVAHESRKIFRRVRCHDRQAW